MTKKILLIDDERKFCDMLKRTLERRLGYEVSVAYSGEEGIEKAQGTAFDLVITDFRMPGMDGEAVITILKTTMPRLPVLLLSVYHDDETVVRPGLLSKADGVVGKPIHHEKLYQTIESLLARGGESR